MAKGNEVHSQITLYYCWGTGCWLQRGVVVRPLRVEFPGAICHVSSRMRGSWKQSRDRLFGDERDRERFIRRLSEDVSHAGRAAPRRGPPCRRESTSLPA